jgi:hypothetical protein
VSVTSQPTTLRKYAGVAAYGIGIMGLGARAGPGRPEPVKATETHWGRGISRGFGHKIEYLSVYFTVILVRLVV